VVWHPDGTTGFSSTACFLPEEKIGFVILMNSSPTLFAGRTFGDELGFSVMRMALGEKPVFSAGNQMNMNRALGRALLGALFIPFLLFIRWRVIRRKTNPSAFSTIFRVVWTTFLTPFFWGMVILFFKYDPIFFPFMYHGQYWDLSLGLGAALLSLTVWTFYSWVVLLRRFKKTSEA